MRVGRMASCPILSKPCYQNAKQTNTRHHGPGRSWTSSWRTYNAVRLNPVSNGSRLVDHLLSSFIFLLAIDGGINTSSDQKRNRIQLTLFK
ncbi:hypothetical protein DPMN_079427 [Dreissena polymorpha]|uniref:Uncharacterized protein n=1 Tax=Dreissena polymorpha TaxID=45954 RepID=A0A9D4BR79_DREPO|nr:hypothetical protein DPMN_079427 [Dreissena polymorpha]